MTIVTFTHAHKTLVEEKQTLSETVSPRPRTAVF